MAAVTAGQQLVCVLKGHNDYFQIAFLITTDAELAEIKIDNILINESTTRIWMYIPNTDSSPLPL